MCQDRFLLLHAAATIEGLKPASLLCLKKTGHICKEKLEILEEHGIENMEMTSRISCPLLLLYDRKLLERTISAQKERRILERYGYSPDDLSSSLENLRRRFAEFSCPCEIGVFLGYPPEDVASYIEKKGKDEIYSGYWKVYHDVEKAKCIEACFKASRDRLISRLESGLCLKEAISEK